MSLRSLLLVPGLLSTSLLLGCGGAPVEKLVPVGGTLLIDGKPLDGVVITFTPELTKKSRGGFGTTDAAGAFTVTHMGQNEPGLAPGKYSVSYSRMRLPDGSAAPKPEPGKPVNPKHIQVETLPMQMTAPDPRATARQVEIPKDGNTKLELKANKKNASGMVGPGIPS